MEQEMQSARSKFLVLTFILVLSLSFTSAVSTSKFGNVNATGWILSYGKNLSLGYDYALNATGGAGISWATAINGTLLNYTDARNTTLAIHTWMGNWTGYNASWSNTTNLTYNNIGWQGNASNFTAVYSYALNDSLWTLNYSTYLLKPTWAQVTNTTLVALNGSTNLWNANQTFLNNYITNGTGGAYIRHNGTGWVIKG